MRVIPTFVFLACAPGGKLHVPGTTVSADADTDADADADADADTHLPTRATGVTGDTAVVDPNPPDWVVDCNGGGDFVVIQDAIVASVTGQRIGVAPCTYEERLDFLGKGIDVFGLQGSSVTILDANGQGSAVHIETGEPEATRFAGFTVREGLDTDDGSAIEVHHAVVELEDLVLSGNLDSWSVVFVDAGMVDLDTVTIQGNQVLAGGHGVFADGGGLTATELIVDCDGGQDAIYHHNSLILSESTVTCATGYGIYDYHGEDSIRRVVASGGITGIYAHDTESTLTEPDNPDERFILVNSVVTGGVGVDVRYMDVRIENSVLSGTTAALSMSACQWTSSAEASVFTGADCGVQGDQSFATGRSAFWANSSDGCGVAVNPAITADPMFVGGGDWHLLPGSPLVDAGPAPAVWNDLDGTRNDIGAYGGPLPL